MGRNMDFQRVLDENLREAAALGDRDLIKDIIERGGNVNSKNDLNGWTPLHWAACRGHLDVVSFLLTAGADKTCRTHSGQLPGNLTGSIEIQNLLGGSSTNEKLPVLPIVPNYLRNPPISTQSVKCVKPSNASNLPGNNSEEELVLKLRLANSEDVDFIEIELQKSWLTFENLKEVCCKELGISSDSLLKIRKLPNTILRKDKDVQRLNDYQELEVVL